MTLPDILSLLNLFVAVPLTWIVAVTLWFLVRKAPRVRIMRAHAVAATMLALIVTIFAAIFVNNSMAVPLLNLPMTQIVTRGSLFLLSTLSAVYWLHFVWRAA